DVVAHPLRVEDERVVAVGLGGQVGERLVVQVGERDRDHVDLGAGCPGEVGGAPLQRLGDLRPGERQDGHLDALVRLPAGGLLVLRVATATAGGDQQRNAGG